MIAAVDGNEEAECVETDRLLKENEIKANHMTTLVTGVTLVIVAITWALFESGFFYIRVQFRGLMIFNILLMLTAMGLAKYFKYERSWIKYSLMSTLTIVYAVTTSALTYNVVLLVTIPIILSIRYFDKRYTFTIAVLSILVFFLAYIYGANHGMLDLNFVQYAPGTTIITNENMWLDDAVRDIPYDPVLMVKNTIISNYFVKLLQLIIYSVAAVKLVGYCQDILDEQKRLTESSARIGAELEMAERIQKDMLPNVFPAFSESEVFDLFASMTPAREVGGDFYDFFMIDDDHLAMVIADVSGKGIPAAMFMMTAKTVIKDYALTTENTDEIFTIVNDRLCENNEAGMFATAWIGILNTRTLKLQFTNAGHNYPMLKRNGMATEPVDDKHGLFLGCMEGIQYKKSEMTLSHGDRLLLYTDGVTESHGQAGELYGEQRLMDVLDNSPMETGEQVLSHILGDVNLFSSGEEQFDDITMTVLTIK